MHFCSSRCLSLAELLLGKMKSYFFLLAPAIITGYAFPSGLQIQFPFFFFNWRIIALQCCSSFCIFLFINFYICMQERHEFEGSEVEGCDWMFLSHSLSVPTKYTYFCLLIFTFACKKDMNLRGQRWNALIECFCHTPSLSPQFTWENLLPNKMILRGGAFGRGD